MKAARWRSAAAFALVSALVGPYYLWSARATGDSFNWKRDEPGYYNFLGRAFAGGHLYLPIEPSPQLLAQPDPWDPHVDDSLKQFDAVLYNKRYYLYHGAGPAVLLFAPFRWITHRDLPENFALFLLCFGGFLFSGGALLSTLELAGVSPGAPMTALLLAGLGLCQGVPFLLNRVWVYEIAVGGGYFFLSGAIFFFARSFLSGRLWMLAASGLMFGISVACRPHMIMAGALAMLIVATQSRRRVLAMAAPFVFVVLLISVYNFERFGSPLEFGTTWQLAGENQGRVKLARANVLPGLYYLLLARPEFSPVFPWVGLPWPPRDFPRPSTYYLEQTVGGLFLAPFIVALPLLLFARRVRLLLSFLALSAGGSMLFVVLTGWSTQRYELDFVPLFIMTGLASFAVATASLRGGARVLSVTALAVCIVFGCVVNLALGISGPYWDMIKNKPLRFVRIAGWFSPIPRHTPVLNPGFDLRFSITGAPGPEHYRDEWLMAGRYPYNYELYAERVAGKAKLFSSFAGSVITADLDAPATFRVVCAPNSGEIVVTRNGAEFLRHRIGTLVSAPSQIVTAHTM